MDNVSPAVRLARLFRGRLDAYGAVHGEAVREPLTAEVWHRHVYGDGSVGVYPLSQQGDQGDDGWYCKWGCVDIDDGYEVGLVIARNLQRALNALCIVSWIEITKSKGYHVWVFAEEWVRAETMQHALRFACQLIDYHPKEVNPKQTELASMQLGNYVNVPYANKWVNHTTTRVVYGRQSGEPYPLELFLDAAEACLTPADKLEAAAALYKPPAPPKTVVFERPTDPWLDHRVKGLAASIMYGELLPSKTKGTIDRSESMLRLAAALAADGFTPGETLSLVQYFDTRNDMNKYVGRPDADRWYREIVERAYG